MYRKCGIAARSEITMNRKNKNCSEIAINFKSDLKKKKNSEQKNIFQEKITMNSEKIKNVLDKINFTTEFTTSCKCDFEK